MRSPPGRECFGAGDFVRAADLAISRLAGAQKELVTRDELLEARLSRDAIAHRLGTGRLSRIHPTVYTTAAGPLTFEQRALAAVLACGPDAALDDGWAAALWRCLSAPPDPPQVVQGGAHRRGPAGVRLRRTGHLDATVHRGVPVLTPDAMLLRLAALGPLGRLEVALDEAQALKLVTRSELERLSASSRPGSRALRTLLAEAPGYSREAAERLLRRLVLRAQLPRPRYNDRVEGHHADAHWPEHRLVVEVDGYATHGPRSAFERDRRLDQRRTAAGYRAVRVTWLQLTQQPEAFVASLAAALALSL